jgi:hypothetical protein
MYLSDDSVVHESNCLEIYKNGNASFVPRCSRTLKTKSEIIRSLYVSDNTQNQPESRSCLVHIA